jgi:hypothetical protein
MEAYREFLVTKLTATAYWQYAKYSMISEVKNTTVVSLRKFTAKKVLFCDILNGL